MPTSCTLPTPERPVREAEFDALFAAASRVVRVADGELRFSLPREMAGTAAELAARETACCSFFTFTLTLSAGALTVGVSVGEQHVAVLDALARRVP